MFLPFPLVSLIDGLLSIQGIITGPRHWLDHHTFFLLKSRQATYKYYNLTTYLISHYWQLRKYFYILWINTDLGFKIYIGYTFVASLDSKQMPFNSPFLWWQWITELLLSKYFRKKTFNLDEKCLLAFVILTFLAPLKTQYVLLNWLIP